MGGQVVTSQVSAAAFYNLDLQGNNVKTTGYLFNPKEGTIKNILGVFQFIGRTKNNKDYEIGNK